MPIQHTFKPTVEFWTFRTLDNDELERIDEGIKAAILAVAPDAVGIEVVTTDRRAETGAVHKT